MTTSKKLFMATLCIFLALSSTLPVFAADARLSHGVNAELVFGITDSGLAEASVDYLGNRSSFTSVTVETYIQKRSLGFIWTKVDNGEVDNTWVDTSTAEYGYFVHHLQLLFARGLVYQERLSPGNETLEVISYF